MKFSRKCQWRSQIRSLSYSSCLSWRGPLSSLPGSCARPWLFGCCLHNHYLVLEHVVRLPHVRCRVLWSTFPRGSRVYLAVFFFSIFSWRVLWHFRRSLMLNTLEAYLCPLRFLLGTLYLLCCWYFLLFCDARVPSTLCNWSCWNWACIRFWLHKQNRILIFSAHALVLQSS